MYAKLKRKCRIAKKKTWESFLNSLNPSIETRFLWGKVNKLRANRLQNFPCLNVDDNSLRQPSDIADGFARFLSSVSSDKGFDSEVIATKNNLNIENLPPFDQQLAIRRKKINTREHYENFQRIDSSKRKDYLLHDKKMPLNENTYL